MVEELEYHRIQEVLPVFQARKVKHFDIFCGEAG